MRSWGAHALTSPLYHHLVDVISEDAELLRVINLIPNWPPPNLLFGAVHYLLLRGVEHDLSGFYRSVVSDPKPPERAGPAFRDFVLTHEDEIERLGRERYTQTNECRRCVALLPAVMATGLQRFHLVEIGASAGLNLVMDQYRYAWDALEWGPDSAVRLETESRGEPPTLEDFEVLSRTGLDLHPIDPSDPDDRRWLDALIWPEHVGRRLRLVSAIELVQGFDVRLVAGDATETLETAISTLPSGEPLVVMDSFSLNQLSSEGRSRIDSIVAEGRLSREIGRVSLVPNGDHESALLRVDAGDGWRDLGRSQHHGEWISLYARP